MLSYSTLFSVRVSTIETTDVVDGSQEMSLAEAQRRLELTTEADLLRGALPKQRGCVFAGFDRRAEGFKHGDVQPEMRGRFSEPYMDSGMVKLLRRAGVLMEDRSLKKELDTILTMCVSEFVRGVVINVMHNHQKSSKSAMWSRQRY